MNSTDWYASQPTLHATDVAACCALLPVACIACGTRRVAWHIHMCGAGAAGAGDAVRRGLRFVWPYTAKRERARRGFVTRHVQRQPSGATQTLCWSEKGHAA
jgi:hypothetical protein